MKAIINKCVIARPGPYTLRVIFWKVIDASVDIEHAGLVFTGIKSLLHNS